MKQTLRRARAFLSAKVAATPMFGHRSVPFDVHLRALMGSALFVATFTALLLLALALVQAAMGFRVGALPNGARLVLTIGVVGWIGAFLLVLSIGGFMFSVTRMILGLIKQNFGWAYAMVGILSGLVLVASAAPSHNIIVAALPFYACVGLITGVTYWAFVCRHAPAAGPAVGPSESPLPTTE